MAAAAARAKVTGTLIKKGAEGLPPLPSSPGSQIFVVGGGASELVVLVVVSGEHGGKLRAGPGLEYHPDLGVHEEHCSTSYITPVLPPDRTAPASSLKYALPPPSGRSCFPKTQR